MTVVIHALVQDADDIDAVGGEAVEQHMRTAGDFEVARAYIVTGLSECRTLRYGLDALPNIAGIRLRLIQSPAVGRVNIVRVGLSAR